MKFCVGHNKELDETKSVRSVIAFAFGVSITTEAACLTLPAALIGEESHEATSNLCTNPTHRRSSKGGSMRCNAKLDTTHYFSQSSFLQNFVSELVDVRQTCQLIRIGIVPSFNNISFK